ncbi:MAG TPA: CesT family type III secretion system chaperone [Acetobacteraceae bacterium]|nr:CesT family type III secretion system chaperone [Acetobacteraceae bacterium]
MFARTQALYDELAKTLGVDALPVDQNGGVQLSVGDNSSVVLFAENEISLLLVSPVTALPKQTDYGTALWLLRRNFYDSPIAPFRVSCDIAGNIVVWGRVPVEGMTGKQLSSLLDALAAEADFIREEVEVDDSPDEDEADDAA